MQASTSAGSERSPSAPRVSSSTASVPSGISPSTRTRGWLEIRSSVSADSPPIAGPAGHDERDRQLVEPVQDVQDELERGDVAPVQVVDRQQRRARLGDARHHREQTVGHREIAGVAGIEQILARPGERAHAFGRLGHEGTAARRRQVVQQGPDELARDAEGEVLLELRPAARSTRTPRLLASSSAASCSRVLPIPACPSSSSARPFPSSRASRTAVIASSKSSRSRSPARPRRGRPRLSCASRTGI